MCVGYVWMFSLCVYMFACVFLYSVHVRDVNGRLNGRRGNQVTVDSGLMRCSGRCQQRDRGSPHLCSAPAHTTHTNYGGGEGVRGQCHRREGPTVSQQRHLVSLVRMP